MKPIRSLLLVFALLSAVSWCYGDAGVIIPLGEERPNPGILSLDDMHITVYIDNGDARVFIQQIYGSHRGNVLEGNYIFALPSRAAISDFAVWDGVTRIPGVILERKRAEEIYNALKWQSIDPGLLQMGERGAEEARRSQVFSARIVPIPGFGTKRIEIEYHETLPVENLESLFAVPLHPDAYQAQSAAHLRIDFELHSQHPIREFQVVGQTFPLKITERGPAVVKAYLEANDVQFKEDFAVRYTLDEAKADSLEVLTYRNPHPPQPDAAATEAPPARSSEPGFFEASALFAAHAHVSSSGGAALAGPPRTFLVLFDTSLSMQWEKLEHSYQAMEALLRSLRPTDRFNVLLFNTELNWFEKQPVTADKPAVERALEFVRAGRLRGGTDLQQALAAALEQAKGSSGESYLILLSDGDATRGLIGTGRLAAWYSQQWKALPEVSRPRTYAFGVGDDANQVLLRLLGRKSRSDGMGPLHGADGFQAECLPRQDRTRSSRATQTHHHAGGELRSCLSARGYRLPRLCRRLGRPIQEAIARRTVRYPGHSGRRSLQDARQRATSRRKTLIIRTCRAPGPRRASMRCWPRSSATARTALPWTKSFAWLASTNSLRPTPRSWRLPGLCCARA